MKLKTARLLLWLACGLMAVFFLLGSMIQNSLMIVLGGVLAFAGTTVWIVFGRCPSCGKYLGRADCKHCPNCGAKIEWDN